MAFQKYWAWLIQKIYEVDSLKCPKCQRCMRVIAFIEDEDDYVIDPDTPVEAYLQRSARREINGKALHKIPVILLG